MCEIGGKEKEGILLPRVYADISRRTFDKWSPLLNCLSPAYENKFILVMLLA
jgi:hypothetical protein